MTITFQQLINMFVEGATTGYSGTIYNPGNLKISGDQMIHYNTPIVERYGDKYILNTTRYSLQTGQVQKKVKETIPPERRIDVKRVPSEVTLSLATFIEK